MPPRQINLPPEAKILLGKLGNSIGKALAAASDSVLSDFQEVAEDVVDKTKKSRKKIKDAVEGKRRKKKTIEVEVDEEKE